MLFTPVKIGPLQLRNRSIRAAAFEGMSQNHNVTQALIDYHQSVAAGGIGMTTVAYASVTKEGLSFPHQLWLRTDIVPELKRLTNAVHKHGAAASIQLGHCGNMSKKSVTGIRPVAPTSRINWYAPSWPKALSRSEIKDLAKAFANAVILAQQSGFDAVEIHAGHGYLISQFLSPFTNFRKDEYGGTLENRMRFMKEVMQEVLEAAGNKTAVIVKMNMSDGLNKGITLDESLVVAKTLEQLGVHALVLSGGFVSRSPMYVLRGAMPVETLSEHVDDKMVSLLVKWFGNFMIPKVKFSEKYFLDDARVFRKTLSMPLIYVGGILSGKNIDDVLDEGFDAVAIARALILDPGFINKMLIDHLHHSSCDTCNHCIAVMYNGPFSCVQNERQRN